MPPYERGVWLGLRIAQGAVQRAVRHDGAHTEEDRGMMGQRERVAGERQM